MTAPAAALKSIVLNGTGLETRAATLAELLDEQGFGGRKVATAKNGDFVPERKRTTTPVSAGDRIEAVSARQGG